MFSGIIEGLGEVITSPAPKQLRLRLPPDGALAKERFNLGASLAVDGCCLTVLNQQANELTFELGEETLQRSSLGNLKVGQRVNLERPLTLSSRLDGHLVSGHIDGRGLLVSVTTQENLTVLTVHVPSSDLVYLVEKGSITLNGVSLTVNSLDERGFSVALLPFTAVHTNLGERQPGDRLNLEYDLVGKYVLRGIQLKEASL